MLDAKRIAREYGYNKTREIRYAKSLYAYDQVLDIVDNYIEDMDEDAEEIDVAMPEYNEDVGVWACEVSDGATLWVDRYGIAHMEY